MRFGLRFGLIDCWAHLEVVVNPIFAGGEVWIEGAGRHAGQWALFVEGRRIEDTQRPVGEGGVVVVELAERFHVACK